METQNQQQMGVIKMTLKEIVTELEILEGQLDDAMNTLPEYNANVDSQGYIDGARCDLYYLKDEIERAVIDGNKVLSGEELEEVMNVSPTLAKGL